MARRKKVKWTELLGEQVIRISGATGRRKNRFTGHLVAGIILMTASALLCGWIHVQSITARYQVSRMLRERTRLVQIRDAFQIEKQMICAPERITGMAEQSFNMHLPREGERVVLK